MNNLKVLKIDSDSIEFEDGFQLYSDHNQDCCESHYLNMSDLSIDNFDGLEFDLSNDNFFRRIDGYGIELVPIKGWSIKIPGYASNNGYYSANLSLVVENKGKIIKKFDITECQDY